MESNKKWTPAIVGFIKDNIEGQRAIRERVGGGLVFYDTVHQIFCARHWLDLHGIDIKVVDRSVGEPLSVSLYDIIVEGEPFYAGYDQTCLSMLIGMGIAVEINGKRQKENEYGKEEV